MKRMVPKNNISYIPISQLHIENQPPVKNKTVLEIICKTMKRKIYMLLILSAIVLIWVFVYYKLLNHRFELPEPLQKLRQIFGDGKAKARQGREDLTENIFIPPISDRSCLKQFQIDRNATVLRIVIVAHGERVNQAIVSMKAIILVTNYNIFFHIFTDDNHIRKNTFKNELESWAAFSQMWMGYSLHRLHFPQHENQKEWLNLFKVAAAQRLFLADTLIDIDAVLYIDTDVLFLRPPEDLWESFHSFEINQIAGLTYECQTTVGCWYNDNLNHPYFKPFGLNSGVMLMNLTRMRKLKWETQLISIYKEYKRAPLTWGDQDILNIYFFKNPEKLYIFSCSWNYRARFCMYGNTCADSRKDGVYALHGNQGVFVNPKAQPEFHAVYNAYKKYKIKTSDFQKDITQKIYKVLSQQKFLKTGCGRMKNQTLKYLSCHNNSKQITFHNIDYRPNVLLNYDDPIDVTSNSPPNKVHATLVDIASNSLADKIGTE